MPHVRHDRAKGASPSKADTFRNAIKRHHLCSSIREWLMPNASLSKQSRYQSECMAEVAG